MLKTFDPRADHGEAVWVVFSGDDPIATHPTLHDSHRPS